MLPESAGRLLGIDNFETMLDPDMERPNPNKQGFGFKDEDGKEVKMEK